jgi:radical SAM superfamily enzyme YgiQ (UPF0313 family)
MKIAISYPPIESERGTPLLSQNRQFQFFNEPTYIYPCVPAYAATLLKQANHEVIWDDGIAGEKSYEQWLKDFERVSPDLVMIETKTPVVKKHWKIIDEIKKVSPGTKVVLVGDHVTALPEESFQNSKVDFVLTGGDYDFLLLNLVNWLEKKNKLEPGIWVREGNCIKNTGKFQLNHDLNELPFIDRELTRWGLYSEKNGNFKKLPGTYTYVGRDCWWHRCTFCSWTSLYNNFRVRKPDLLVDEIGLLIEKYNVKTVFDDTGTFPVGEWLRKFCELMIERDYNKEIDFSCNMRLGACGIEDYKLMKKAGFRMLLFGLESANQKTLDKINKNLKVEQITDSCKKAKEAGLEPHLTIMLGYPWEKKEDSIKTFELAKHIFEKGYADTLQATIMVPYPGTPLFEYCKENGLLTTENWDNYEMRKLVMKTEITEEDVKEITQKMYKLFFDSNYIFRKFLEIRNFDDMRFMFRSVKKVFGHIKDFSIRK